jgi:hypothetical protein
VDRHRKLQKTCRLDQSWDARTSACQRARVDAATLHELAALIRKNLPK